MKQGFKILAAGTVCAFTLTSAAFAVTGSEETITSADELIIDGIAVPQEMLLQQDALNAYQVLYSSFEMDDNYNYILPDDYAGEYIDDSYNLVVQLTTDDYSEYELLLDEFDCVEFKTVEYSYNELKALADNAFQSIADTESMEDIQRVASYVSVQQNKAIIEIGTESPVEQESAIPYSMGNLPLEINYVQVEPDTQANIPNQSGNAVPAAASSDTMTLVGGKEIQDGYYYPTYSTMAICGTYNGKNAILTSGHGVHLNNRVFCDNVEIGTVSFSRFSNNQNGDFGIVTLNDNAIMTNRVKYQTGTIPITSTVYSVPSGTTCYNYGSVSGYTKIEIKETQDIYYPDEEITVKGLIVADIISGQSIAGDSGCPYYTLLNGKWTFCGVHSGYKASENEVYFTPYLHIYAIFTVKTS